MQSLELAPIFGLPFENINKLDYYEKKKKHLNETVYEHNFLFSRMRGIEEEDLDFGAWRYVIAEANQFYTTKIRKDESNLNSDKITNVFQYNEKERKYLPVGTVNEFTANEDNMQKLKDATTQKKTLSRLMGKEEDEDLTSEIYANPMQIDIRLKNGDREYICKKMNFKQPIGNFIIPVRSDNEHGFEFAELGFTNSFYRITNHPALTSFVHVPHDTCVGFMNTLDFDEEQGKIALYLPNNNDALNEKADFEFASVEDLYADESACKKIAECAVHKEAFFDKLISVADENTQVFLDVNI
jgi:hypothetical protein